MFFFIETFPNQKDFCVNKINISSFNDTINILNPTVKTNKLARYVFPRVDPPTDPNWFKDDRKPTEKMLDIMCNSLSLLNQDEYVHYSQFCQRDIKFMDKSKQGIYATENYVEALGVGSKW